MNLKEDGFQVFVNNEITELVNRISTDLESIALNSKPENVFRTLLGDIKQIQGLDFGILNDKLVSLINKDNRKYEILNNQYFCKPGNYKETSPHQDNAYFESNEDIYTFWIPLQDVDINNSCMFYLPQSHLKGLIEHKEIGTTTRTRTGKTGKSLYSDYYKKEDFISVPMKKGEILVHDKNTMHYSSPNITDNYRYAITCIVKFL